MIEIAVVTVVVGVLAAMSFPAMSRMQARNNLRSSMDQIKAAVAETQRSAIRRGSNCRVAFTASTVAGTTAGCVSSPISLPAGQTLAWNSGLNNGIAFSYKGNTTQSGTLVLRATGVNEMKCLVISNGLGIFRTGSYSGSVTPADIVATNCQKNL